MRRLVFTIPLLVAAIAFFAGINWGLPSRDSDRFLFGDRTPWTGKEILALTGGWGSPDRPSDHDANPLKGRDDVIVVNATDAQRAEIVQRYRLYTHQPDEMITLRAFAQMRPGEIRSNLWAMDPKMYQYGGLWVYPLGALVKIGDVLGLIEVRGDVAYYLDHPETFARLYIVMRAYSAMWGLAGVVAVMWIVHRMTRSTLVTVVAGISFALLPVVVNMAHEAKPHLAGAVLLLWTVLAAARYVERGGIGRAALTGVVWGAATGMVLLSLPGGIILLAMVALQRQPWTTRLQHFAIAVISGVAVYCVTNPYVLLHAIYRNGPLATNVENYGNFYRIADLLNGLGVGVDLMIEGTSLLLAAGGAITTLLVARKLWATLRRSSTDPSTTATYAVLLAAPAMVVALQFVLLGAGKPGEYGRFAILPDVVLMIACVVGAIRIRFPGSTERWVRRTALIVPALVVVISGGRHVANFVADRSGGTRTTAAKAIEQLGQTGKHRLAIIAEPAPYCVPPVDLFRWQMMLLPKDAIPPQPDVFDAYVAAVDRARPTLVGFRRLAAEETRGSPWPARISWANKPIDLFTAEPLP